MNTKLTQLVQIDSQMERLFARAIELARSEPGGDKAVDLWVRARIADIAAFDEHDRVLRENARQAKKSADKDAAETVDALRQVASYDHSSRRLSTFTQVENDKDLANVAALRTLLKKEEHRRNQHERNQ